MKAHLSADAVGRALAGEALRAWLPRCDDPAKAAAGIALALLHSAAGQSEYIGEAVSQVEHAQQAAHFAAIETEELLGASGSGTRDDVVVASLLHDVGHLLPHQPQMAGNLGVVQHEKLGAAFLDALGFPEITCALVARHVDAKRYLCRRNPGYHDALSDASKGTLKLQGGVMSEEEAAAFEKDPLSRWIVKMRTWDEKAKIASPKFPIKPAHEYFDVLARCVMRRRAKEAYDRDGYVLLKDLLSPDMKRKVVAWCDEVCNWPARKGEHMVYHEIVDGKEVHCRTENFLPYHQGLRELLTSGELRNIVDELLGAPSVVYKEKINMKLGGGAGFPAHQDAPAFETFGQKMHISVNIAIDAATPANGCLEVSPGEHKRGLFEQDPSHGGLTKRAEVQIPWISVPLEPGDVLIFSSWLPHRSAANHTKHSRRALYVTYNDAASGDRRDDYYVHKREVFPPKDERDPGKDYSEGAKRYALATPII